jgi:hypothetical protein
MIGKNPKRIGRQPEFFIIDDGVVPLEERLPHIK